MVPADGADTLVDEKMKEDRGLGVGAVPVDTALSPLVMLLRDIEADDVSSTA